MVLLFQILGRLRHAIARHGLVAVVVAASAAASTLAGCGQKGPLFLPPPAKTPAATTPAATSPPLPAPAPP